MVLKGGVPVSLTLTSGLGHGPVRSQGLDILTGQRTRPGRVCPKGHELPSHGVRESRQLGELFRHPTLVLGQSRKAGALPQQRRTKGYEIFLQKHPMSLSCQNLPLHRGEIAAAGAKGEGMNSGIAINSAPGPAWPPPALQCSAPSLLCLSSCLSLL